MKNPIRTGTMIAMTAATLFASACGSKSSSSQETTPAPAATEQTAKVHCQGVNECKGTGACQTATNACGGKNECKGKGWVEVASAEECTGKGGTVAQ